MNTQTITIRSHKGGQGQTFAACMAGLVGSRFGRTVLFTDSDDALATLGLPNNGDTITEVTDTFTIIYMPPHQWQIDTSVIAEYSGANSDTPPAFIVTDLRDTPDPIDMAAAGLDVVNVVVVKPEYVALRATVAKTRGHAFHILTHEKEGAALTPKDVAAVLNPSGYTITVPHTAALARVIDAGLVLHSDRPDTTQYAGAISALFTAAAITTESYGNVTQ